MRLKIIAKTPESKDFSKELAGTFRVYGDNIVKVINADTGEIVEGITSLDLLIRQDQVIQAQVRFDVSDLDLDIEAEVA